MFWADSLGSNYIYSRLEEWSKQYGGFFKPCGYLAERAVQGATLVRNLHLNLTQLLFMHLLIKRSSTLICISHMDQKLNSWQNKKLRNKLRVIWRTKTGGNKFLGKKLVHPIFRRDKNCLPTSK